ncbi:hypothetical protein P4H66_05605 [Paenibacillus dokdonensis]|uniref:Uncharacterized protein n=1 Tax=Paenibacillus dokdonensis TaxID=2567944 RepID=A0ABU6GJG0_9BACL|nr:hypothetical protein [Paenibacillus dokdonensis]MEC0239333.1 hypothetical protein [Paenibacillus dokdonensis]
MFNLQFECKEIMLSRIEPLYVENTSKKGLLTKTNLILQGNILHLPLIVQKDKHEDKYWLIAGFPEFEAYKECDIEIVRCHVQLLTSDTEQRHNLLRRMFQYERNTWIDRHKLIDRLVTEGYATKEIGKRIGVTEGDIKHYLVHPEIPEDIVQLAFAFKRSFPNLEIVRRLRLHHFIKDRLYQSLVEGNLSGDMIQKLKWLLTRTKFELLDWKEQWEIIDDSVINYKEHLLSHWEEQIEKHLNVFA